MTIDRSRSCRAALLACCLALAALLLSHTRVTAAPRDELLQLVPDDTGFCLVVQNLREHSAGLLSSPFVKQFRSSPLFQTLANAPELQKLDAAEKLLQKNLGIEWVQLRDDILGDAVVLAYRPGPPGKPDQEQGIVLLHARNAKLLAELVERLNKLQKESGELKEVKVWEHAGQKYYQRVERDKSSFYYIRDSLLAFTGQEDLIHKAIERAQNGGTEEHFVTRQMHLLGVDRQLAALWINPRIFQPEMEQKASTAKGQEAITQKAFLSYWKALDGIALTVSLDKDIECALTLRAKVDQLPAAARRLFTEAAQPTKLWNRFPDNTLLTAAGRIDALALLDLIGDFQTKEDNQALRDSLHNLSAAVGKDIVKEILPHVGPDCGMCILAPPASEPAWFPQAVALLRVRPGEKGEQLDQSLLASIHSFAFMVVLNHNRQNPDKLTLQSVTHDKTEIKYLASDKLFPPGLQPAFAVREGFLVLASSPNAIRRVADAAPRDTQQPTSSMPLVQLSTKELRKFIKDRRDPLTSLLAEKNQMTREEVGKQLDKLLLTLEPVDRLELSQRTQVGQVTISLRVQTAQPLK